MTKEDAKKFLYSIADDLGFTGVESYTCKDGDKMRDAIKALEQEPCEDAVSREAVLMEIDKYMCGVPFDEKGIDVVLKELPHVTPARKKGKWICVHHIENKITYDSWKCSECQHDFNSEEESMVYFNEYKYCPNCGAEMEREE